MRRSVKRMLASAAVLAGLGAGAVWLVGSSLVAVAPHAVALEGLDAEQLFLHATPHQRVAASYLVGRGRAAVLLLHGIRADRRQMIERARFLQRQGYAVMLIDLPGQGASSADAVTFGLHEAHGVRAALDELRRRAPGQRIGVIGVSLGAASLVLCRDCGQVDAVVLESMYPTIEKAVGNRLRMRLGAVGEMLSPVLLWQLPVRLDIAPDQLRPIDRIGLLHAPLLVLAGDRDRHTTLPETERLFAAAAQPKQLWVVHGAAHVDLHAFARLEYERRVGAFLARTVAPVPAVAAVPFAAVR